MPSVAGKEYVTEEVATELKAVNAVSAALKSFIVLPVLTSKPTLNLFKPPNV